MHEGARPPATLPLLYSVLIVGALVGFGAGALFLNVDGRTVSVRAHGETEWMYQDTHGADHPLDPERFGTPSSPKGLEILPIANRDTNTSGTAFTGLKDGQVFSLDRTMVEGSVYFSGTDRTALDSVDSKDSAEGEATFTGPDGAMFRVVFRGMMPLDFRTQTFGGVAINQPVHANSGFGTDKLYTEYTHLLVQGLADVYRDGRLIVKDNYLWLAATRRAQFITNADKQAGTYNSAQPFGDMIIHLVLLPYQLLPDGSYANKSIPTGVIGLDGQEQGFFHINYRKNISMHGSKFFTTTPPHATSTHAH